ncbi:hypothetical protein [Streptomyces sp. NPDC059371]|uniref:hypothetical protein n=1 Tax=Streptomyces sp. NPDC059371 TaxID=3346812 RepID=UPI003684A92E
MSSSDDMLQAVDDFVQTEIGSERFLLVDESFGGYLARALTRRRADQVLGPALIDTQVGRITVRLPRVGW